MNHKLKVITNWGRAGFICLFRRCRRLLFVLHVGHVSPKYVSFQLINVFNLVYWFVELIACLASYLAFYDSDTWPLSPNSIILDCRYARSVRTITETHQMISKIENGQWVPPFWKWKRWLRFVKIWNRKIMNSSVINRLINSWHYLIH